MASRKKTKKRPALPAQSFPEIALSPEDRQRVQQKFLELQDCVGSESGPMTKEDRRRGLQCLRSIVELYYELTGEKINPKIQAALELTADN